MSQCWKWLFCGYTWQAKDQFGGFLWDFCGVFNLVGFLLRREIFSVLIHRQVSGQCLFRTNSCYWWQIVLYSETCANWDILDGAVSLLYFPIADRLFWRSFWFSAPFVFRELNWPARLKNSCLEWLSLRHLLRFLHCLYFLAPEMRGQCTELLPPV